MISITAAVIWIVVFAAIGLLYFLVMLSMKKINQNVEREYLMHQDEQKNASINNDQESQELFVQKLCGKDQIAKLYQSAVNQINDCFMKLFLNMLIFLSIFSVVFFLLFGIWFRTKKSIVIFIITYLLGLGITAIITLFTMKLSLGAAAKLVFEAISNVKNTFKQGYGSSIAILCFFISILLIVIGLGTQLIVFSYFKINKKDEQNNEIYTNLFMGILGFAIGTIIGSFFFREIGNQLSSGIILGGEIIGKNFDNLYDQEVNIDVERQLDKIKVVSNTFKLNLNSVLDFTCFFTCLICLIFLLSAQSKELIKQENFAAFYFPFILIGFVLLVTIIFSFIPEIGAPGKDLDNLIVSTYTAKSIRLQIALVNFLTFLIFIFVPVFFIPFDGFSMGTDEKSSFYIKQISQGDVVWCLLIGLTAQVLLLSISEYSTSHAFSPTKSVSKQTSRATGSGIIESSIIANLSTIISVAIISIMLMLCMIFAGFYGVAMAGIGLISSPVMLIGINFFASQSANGYILASLGRFGEIIREKITKISWAAKNYIIYMVFLNSFGILLVNVVCIGLIISFMKLEKFEIIDMFTLFGFFIGGGFAYLIRGLNTLNIKKISESVIQDEKDRVLDQKKKEQGLLENLDIYISKKIISPMIFMMINIFSSIICIILITGYLGPNGTIGYLVGLNFIAIHITIYSAVQSQSLHNARIYNSQRSYQQKQVEANKNSVQVDIAGQTNENFSLNLYLLLNTFFVLWGTFAMANWGNPGQKLVEKRDSFTDKSIGYARAFGKLFGIDKAAGAGNKKEEGKPAEGDAAKKDAAAGGGEQAAEGAAGGEPKELPAEF